jgi:hypothetical protein
MYKHSSLALPKMPNLLKTRFAQVWRVTTSRKKTKKNCFGEYEYLPDFKKW